MTLLIVAALAMALIAALVIGTIYASNTRHSERLREQFGHEYHRAVSERGNRRAAEAELDSRTERVAALRSLPLRPSEAERYRSEWILHIQARFVDDPTGAVRAADRLVAEVMQVRGYPMRDFEERAADISVDYPNVVPNYRQAHAIALANDRDEANTEQLRVAMLHYHALFDDLLGPAGEAEQEQQAA